MAKPRVLYYLAHYPQISETYILSELEAIVDTWDVQVIGRAPASHPAKSPAPYEIIEDLGAVAEAIQDFKPDVLHTHWLEMATPLWKLARKAGIPFTVRSHSFDVVPLQRSMGPVPVPRPLDARLPGKLRALGDDLCLGVLAFPYKRAILEASGVASWKVVDTWPVVNYARFHDTSPRPPGVMNVGAALPKKQMEDFLELAKLHRHKPFRLYPLAYQTEAIKAKCAEMEAPVEIMPSVEPTEMAAEFRKHDWLVYTASFEMNSVGWPMAVAEAQAAGLGVAVPNLRPDLRDYVGPAGILYDSISEVVDVVSSPPSEEIREIGFEHAKRSDIAVHISALTDLWDAPVGSSTQPTA